MSADQEARGPGKELDAEQEIDLGRFWRAILDRWWLVLVGVILGAIVGLAVSLSSGNTFKGTAEIYLGQPLAPGGNVAISGTPISLALTTTYLASEQPVRVAAERSGMTYRQLRRGLSTKPIVGFTGSKVGSATPLLQITVKGTNKKKAAQAANTLAVLSVRKLSPYTRSKIATLKAIEARDQRQIAEQDRRIEAAQAAQQQLIADKTLGATEKLVAVTNYNLVVSSAIQQRSVLQTDLGEVQQQIAAAESVEQPRVVSRATGSKQGGASRRTGVIVGAVIGFLLGILVAVLWDPVASRVRPHTA